MDSTGADNAGKLAGGVTGHASPGRAIRPHGTAAPARPVEGGVEASRLSAAHGLRPVATPRRSLTLTGVGVTTANGTVRLEGTITAEGEGAAAHGSAGGSTGTMSIYFEFPDAFESMVCPRGDAFAALLLLPAMQRGATLTIETPVSARLIAGLATLQDIFCSWWPDLVRPIEVIAPAMTTDPPGRDTSTPPGVSTFFSLGVDSFYTALKSTRGWRSPAPPVTHLVYMRGLEKPLDEHNGEGAPAEQVHRVAERLGVQCIEGATNLRSVFQLDWGKHYHGSGLAATGLALGAGLSHVLIPAARPYRDLGPSGASPLIDVHFSTEHTTVIHDGCERSRVEKIEALVGRDEVALDHLRVCLENEGGDFNCGRCRKCLVTAAALAMIGQLPRAATFPSDFTPDMVQRISVNGPEDLRYLEQLAALGERCGTDPALVRALQRRIIRRRRRDALDALAAGTPLRPALGLCRGIRAGIRRLRHAAMS